MLFSISTKSLSRKRGEERERKILRVWERAWERVWESLRKKSLKEKEVEREREKHAPWSPQFLASRGRFEGGRLRSQGCVSPGISSLVSASRSSKGRGDICFPNDRPPYCSRLQRWSTTCWPHHPTSASPGNVLEMQILQLPQTHWIRSWGRV